MVQIIKILRLLSEAEADCVLVGGVAAASYGSTLLTQDIDLAASMETKNLITIQAALSEFGPVRRMSGRNAPFSAKQAANEPFRNLYLGTALGQIDFLGSIKGVGDYPDVREASVTLDMDGFSIRILSIDALIRSKEAMARPRDLENAAILRAIRDRT